MSQQKTKPIGKTETELKHSEPIRDLGEYVAYRHYDGPLDFARLPKGLVPWPAGLDIAVLSGFGNDAFRVVAVVLTESTRNARVGCDFSCRLSDKDMEERCGFHWRRLIEARSKLRAAGILEYQGDETKWTRPRHYRLGLKSEEWADAAIAAIQAVMAETVTEESQANRATPGTEGV
jgi:hypothetical protein